MLPFFRKIRWRLAQNNQFLKYSRYAIGEIVLVVIGILIALQINNWNEERKNKNAERLLLTNLKSDFLSNQDRLTNYIQWHDSSTEFLKKFLQALGPDAQVGDIDSLDYYVASAYYIPEYEPKNGAINSIFSSGEINLIDDQKIIDILNLWRSALGDYYKISEIIREENIKNLHPFLHEHYPGKNWALTVGANLSPKTQHEFPVEEMLQSPSFENLILIRTINAQGLADKAKELQEIQTEILSLIDKQLND